MSSGQRKLGRGAFGLRRPALVLLVALVVCSGARPSTAPAATPAGVSIVAQARRASVTVFQTPGAKRPFGVFRNPTANGTPLVFLVRRRTPGWVEVRLAIRPSGSVGWVRRRAVTLATDPYKITISLGSHRITVWKSGRTIAKEPAGVGRSVLPTPTGVYYIAELLRQPDPGGPYGPYAFGLSAYSSKLYSFGGGPGQIGLHGTNEPGLLGSSVSHGCIRVTNSLITRLARILPLGTPVVIAR